MPRRRGLLGQLYREIARAQRAEQQARRTRARAEATAHREAERARKATERQAAATERERRRLYVEERKAEAESLNADLRQRVAELENVLQDGLRQSAPITFSSLKLQVDVPGFDPGGLQIAEPEPQWVPPPRPTWLGRMFGGDGRQRAELAEAWREHERRCEQHAARETARRDRLEQLRREYEQRVARAEEEVRRHNAEVDQFSPDVEAREQQAVGQYVRMVLDGSVYPEGFPRQFRVLYQAEPRAIVVEYELPGGELIPTDRRYKYVQSRDAVEAAPRPIAEVRALYRSVIAQVALRTLHEVFGIAIAGLVDAVTFNGHVFSKDPGTGQPTTLYVITLTVTRDRVAQLALADVDPVTCLKQLGALFSHHPYDLEPVRPVVDFERLLTQYDFVESMDAAAALDSRPDLLEMTAAEFEHLVRQLFEAMGMQAWNTVESKDDGVDAVVTNPDPVFGGLCIVQAKRYRGAVGVEAIRALAGTMEDKHAQKGFLVTTSWVARGGQEFIDRHGRIEA